MLTFLKHVEYFGFRTWKSKLLLVFGFRLTKRKGFRVAGGYG